MRRLIEKLRRFSPGVWLTISAGIFLVFLAVQVVRYAMAGEMAGELSKVSLALSAAPEREEAKELEAYKTIAEKGHFGKKKPPPKPQLFGILGEFAFMGNSPQDAKPYAIGAQFPSGEKLVEIHLNSVVLEKDGKRQTLKVFPDIGDKVTPSAPGPRGPGGPPQPVTPILAEKPPAVKPEARVEIRTVREMPDMEAVRREMREEMMRRFREGGFGERGSGMRGRFPRGRQAGREEEEEP